jgi:hypothetical protein
MNHCRNSATDSSSWNNLSRCARKSDANALSIVFLSPAELRAKFDRLKLAELAITNEYMCCLKGAYQVQLATEPSPVTAIVVGFRDDEERTRFLVHAFVRQDGSIAGSGLCDPKLLYDDGWVCFKTK